MRSSITPWLAASVVAFIAEGALAAPACPPGKRPGISGCRDTAPLSTRPTMTAAAAPSTPKPRTPMPELRPEQALLERADRRLLIEEIARLERLVATLPKKATDRARILLRLGDDYAELAKIAEREMTEQEMIAEAARAEMEEQERRSARPRSETPPAGPPHRPVRF